MTKYFQNMDILLLVLDENAHFGPKDVHSNAQLLVPKSKENID